MYDLLLSHDAGAVSAPPSQPFGHTGKQLIPTVYSIAKLSSAVSQGGIVSAFLTYNIFNV